MLIRSADPANDAAVCAAIYAPFVLHTAISFEEVAPDAAEFVRRIEETHKRFPWLVAEVEGSVAGYAYASAHRDRAAYRWAADVAIYVAETRRRRGLGKALYSELLSLLTQQGLRTVCAGVTLPNPASVALHEACGFTPVGVYRRIGFKSGRWWDVGWWQLELVSRGGDPPAEPAPPDSRPPSPR